MIDKIRYIYSISLEILLSLEISVVCDFFSFYSNSLVSIRSTYLT